METLSNGTTQIGAVVDPGSFRMQWNCWPVTYPIGYTGCMLTGQTRDGSPITTPSNYGDVTAFLGVTGPDPAGSVPLDAQRRLGDREQGDVRFGEQLRVGAREGSGRECSVVLTGQFLGPVIED